MEELSLDVENLAAVWARVSSPVEGPRPEAPSDGALLRELMEAKARAAAEYASLLRRVRNKAVRVKLARILSDERRQLCTLRAEYLLTTGAGFGGEMKARGGMGVIASLRKLYAAETESARSFDEAAGKACGAGLSSLLRGIAEEERGHADKLREIAGLFSG